MNRRLKTSLLITSSAKYSRQLLEKSIINNTAVQTEKFDLSYILTSAKRLMINSNFDVQSLNEYILLQLIEIIAINRNYNRKIWHVAVK